jgi:uncharacterized protein YkwD
MKPQLLPLALACLSVLAGTAKAGEVPDVSATAPVELEQRVLALANEARARGRSCGSERFDAAPPLQASASLREAAGRHARDMARRGYFDHVAPDGSRPKERVQRAGYTLQLIGENIAFGPESAEEVVAGWLASPGHCANLMDPRFRDMGVAVAKGHKARHFYWVQNLGAPAPR